MKKKVNLKIPKPSDMALDIMSGISKATDIYENTGDGKTSAIIFASNLAGSFLTKFSEMNASNDYENIGNEDDKDNE